MPSLMFINSSSSFSMDSHLIHLKLRNSGFLLRHDVGQLYLRTTASRFLGQLCLQTTASRRGCFRQLTADGMTLVNQISPVLEIKREIKTEVSRLKYLTDAVPGLAVIQVGDTKLPNLYPCCKMLGMKPFVVSLAENSSEEEVLKSVSCFNDDRCVHGIVVQSRLPSHIDEQKILNAVSIEKDVNGFHPHHIGRLTMKGIEPLYVPPAPKACIELIRRYNLKTYGKRAVVLGTSYRSYYRFCMPAAMLLEREGAVVTIVHSKTKSYEEITKQADIVIFAVGEQNLVGRENWIKPGAVIIDVGSRALRYEDYEVASTIPLDDGIRSSVLITMMCLSNVLASAKRFHKLL